RRPTISWGRGSASVARASSRAAPAPSGGGGPGAARGGSSSGDLPVRSLSWGPPESRGLGRAVADAPPAQGARPGVAPGSSGSGALVVFVRWLAPGRVLFRRWVPARRRGREERSASNGGPGNREGRVRGRVIAESQPRGRGCSGAPGRA